MWMYILTILSAVMLFGFMGIGVKKYGLLSCYSAYGPLWDKWHPKLNIWSVITFISAALMVPALLEVSVFSAWQFLGFLAPVSLFWVAASPNYQTDKFANIMHQCGAWGAVVAAISYIVIISQLWGITLIWWIVAGLALAAVVLGLVFKGTLMLWGEIAVYSSIYSSMLITITKYLEYINPQMLSAVTKFLENIC